jgi:putative ABC transport system permease protein
VLTFGLGIGITTAVFSLFYGVLIRPIRYPDPDQLVMVFDIQPACSTCPASFTKLDDWRTNSNSFSAMAGSSSQQAVVSGPGDPERVAVSRTTWKLPQVFGVTPALGRWHTADEDTPGGPKTVTIDGEPHEIVS